MRQDENTTEVKRLMEAVRVSILTPFEKQTEYKKIQTQINKKPRRKR